MINQMNKACDSCAFRQGSETHDREPYNRFRGQVAALAGAPFFCHHGLNWRKPIATKRGFAFDCDGNVQRLQVCEGWKDQVGKTITSKTKNKHFRRGLGRLVFDTLDTAIAEDRQPEKAELWSELRRLFKLLMNAANLKIKRSGTDPVVQEAPYVAPEQSSLLSMSEVETPAE